MKLKKIICLLLASALIASVGVQAGAIQIADTNAYWADGVHTDGINNDAGDQAVMLKQLGLFLGTEKGFELERRMTRAEAAVMLVRFLGAEKKVMAGTWSHPFTDVPVWAGKYIGWLYKSGLTKGISSTKYGSSQYITLQQYAVFLSRAISGNDNWESNGVATSDEVTLWDKTNGLFTRAAAVGLSVRALSLTYTQNGNWSYTMAQFLVNNGAFTAAQLQEAAWGVLPPEYLYLDDAGYIYNCIAGVVTAKTSVGGFTADTGTESPLNYFYATSETGQLSTLYRIDCKTMQCTPIQADSIRKGSWEYTYVSTIDGADYLFETSFESSLLNLVKCEGGYLTSVLADVELNDGSVYPWLNSSYFTAQDSILVAGSNSYYLVRKDGFKEIDYAAETQVLGFDGNSVVTQYVTAQNTIISCLSAEYGSILDKYTVDQDFAPEKELPRTVEANDSGLFYGEAGLYKLNSASGHLEQITERPVLDITAFRNDTRYIILTHAPGERVWGENSFGGNQIILLENDATERVLLGNNPKHGILIAGFIHNGSGSTVAFYSAADQGMQHFDIFKYALLPSYNASAGIYDGKQPGIVVTGFTAGRPETEPKGYALTYTRQEQARLDALGY